jgi:hypothetical protein
MMHVVVLDVMVVALAQEAKALGRMDLVETCRQASCGNTDARRQLAPMLKRLLERFPGDFAALGASNVLREEINLAGRVN